MNLDEPTWLLRIEEGRVAIVLQGAHLPGGAQLEELAIHLPHVDFPFDFRGGVSRFRHHRGAAQVVEISIEARLLLDWIHRVSGGSVTGRATDDSLVLMGVTEGGARYTACARFVPEVDDGEPSLLLSLYDIRVYGSVPVPWPVLASGILNLLPESLVSERTLTAVRLRPVRLAITGLLSGMGWKLPSLAGLVTHGVELRDGCLTARFLAPELATREMVPLESVFDHSYRASVEGFLEDLELKRHHGQVDRLLADDQVREALAEIYRALDGPPEPGFLAERLIGICASRAILYDEGERVCKDLLEESPNYPPALCGLASIAMGKGRSEEAAVYMERLAAVWAETGSREDATAADLTLAELLHHSDPMEARAALERVLRRSPDHEVALEALIAHAEATEDEATSVPLYKRLLFSARSPERTREAGLRLARHALKRHAPEEARVFLKVVLEASPHDTSAKMALAEVESLEGNPLEAARILEGALRTVSPSRADVLAQVVTRLALLALEALHEPGRARRVLWRAVDAPSLAVGDALALARLAVRAGDPILAARYADRVSEDDAAAPEAGCIRARAHLDRGDREAALTDALAVLDKVPGHSEALALLEEAASGVEVRERLLYRLRKAVSRVEEAGPRARLHLALARLYESLDLVSDAVSPYEEVLDSDPNCEDAGEVADRLLDLYASLGMWERHQVLCGRLLETMDDPLDRVPLLVEFGRVAQREMDRPAEARKALEEATDLAPRRPEALEILWEALEALEDPGATIPVLRRLWSVHPEVSIRVAAGCRLAELLLDVVGDPGQARAVLQALPASAAGRDRIIELRRTVGLPPVPTIPSTGEADADASTSLYTRAVSLADTGDPAEATSLLDLLLEAQPGHVPARELREHLRRASITPMSLPAAGTVGPGISGSGSPIQGHSPAPALPPTVVKQLEESMRLEESLGEATGLLAAGRTREAEGLIDRVLQQDAEHVQALELKADLVLRRQDWAALPSVLERLADLAFDATLTLAYTRERALVLERHLGDREGAALVWARYLDWEPLDDEAFQRLMAWYREQEAWPELADLQGRRASAAEERIPDAVDPAPLRMAARQAYLEEARLRLFRLDEPEAAVSAAQGGLGVASDDPELLEIEVRALAMTNQREACRQSIDRLMPQLVDGPLKDEMVLLRGA